MKKKNINFIEKTKDVSKKIQTHKDGIKIEAEKKTVFY